MMWVANPKKEYRSRYGLRFALWPTLCTDHNKVDHWVWLRTYWVYYFNGIFGWRKTQHKFTSLAACHKFDGV
jgi:hypothetical protein